MQSWYLVLQVDIKWLIIWFIGEHKGSFHVSVCVSVNSCFILKFCPYVVCVAFQFLLLCDFLAFFPCSPASCLVISSCVYIVFVLPDILVSLSCVTHLCYFLTCSCVIQCLGVLYFSILCSRLHLSALIPLVFSWVLDLPLFVDTLF